MGQRYVRHAPHLSLPFPHVLVFLPMDASLSDYMTFYNDRGAFPVAATPLPLVEYDANERDLADLFDAADILAMDSEFQDILQAAARDEAAAKQEEAQPIVSSLPPNETVPALFFVDDKTIDPCFCAASRGPCSSRDPQR